MKTFFYTVAVFLVLSISHTFVGAQVLPPERTVNWKLAGLRGPIPQYGNIVNITNFGGVGNGIIPNDFALQAAILSLGADSGIIFFPAGTYLFVSNITLRGGLVLRGEGSGSTILQFNLSTSDNLITIPGSQTNNIASVRESIAKNQNFLLVNNPGLYTAGDYVQVYQNDSALVLDVFRSVGQIMQIQNIAGDTLTFTSPLRRNYNFSDSPRLRKLTMVSGVGIECLKIKRLDSTATQLANIQFRYATNCWIKGVESDSCNFAHISINNSTNIYVTGSYFHGSFGYGPNGRGYGIAIQNTSGEVLIENNIFRRLRHSVLLQSGANGNVLAYNYSREPFKSESTPFDLAGDIVLHGNYPYANLFEGNIVQNIAIDASHKINGPFNTFFRNRAELYGILVSSNSGDSLNVVGNEITSTAPSQGNYLIRGNGNFEFANNVKGVIFPIGTNSLNDNSYYYNGKPWFWNISSAWPSVGVPNTIGTGTIPAKQRHNESTIVTICATNTLPVRFIEFSAQKSGITNLLAWQVATANDGYTFEVERSADGRKFNRLSIMRSAAGEMHFQYNDLLPIKGVNYYRIKQVSKSGTFVYSKIVAVDNHIEAGTVRLFPNPASDKLYVTLPAVARKHSLIITNSTGQIVYVNDLKNINNNTVTIDIASWAPGTYFVQIKEGNLDKTKSLQFIKK
jgi:hypothetical protein